MVAHQKRLPNFWQLEYSELHVLRVMLCTSLVTFWDQAWSPRWRRLSRSWPRRRCFGWAGITILFAWLEQWSKAGNDTEIVTLCGTIKKWFNFLPSILLRNRPHSLTSVPETKGTNICTFSPSSWASSASSGKSTAWSSASSWYQVTNSSLGMDQLIGQWFLHKMKNRLRFPATRGCSSQKSLTGNESMISPATRGIALWLNSARLTKSQQKALSVAKKTC